MEKERLLLTGGRLFRDEWERGAVFKVLLLELNEFVHNDV